MSVTLQGGELRLEDVRRVARERAPVALSEEARSKIARSRGVVQEALESNDAVYGINTGFGKLKSKHIARAQLTELQRNLVRSHAVGVGQPLATDVVRAMGLLRAESLAIGVSGVSPECVDRIVDLLNRGIHPVIPSQGSVGASGDLAPLSHFALVLMGEGEAELDGETMPGAEALRRAGLEPVELGPKDGLALINGTQQATATLALALSDLDTLLHAAVIAAAVSLEGAMGSVLPFSEHVAGVRPHPGHDWVAARIRQLTTGSEIGSAHADCERLQDPYSLRCTPQVLGAAVDGIRFAREMVERELAAATDNPLVFPEVDAARPWRERVVSAGNFHGQPISLAADVATVALGSLTSIAERRIDLLLDASRSELPPFLTPDPGVRSGMMIVQYTAAALASENKTLAHPASVDTIPTSAGWEDHVSMSPWSARKLVQSLANARRVVAAEFLVACQAIDVQSPLRPGAGCGAVHAAVRERVPSLGEDRSLAPDLENLAQWIAEDGPRAAVQSATSEWSSPWSDENQSRGAAG